MSIQLKLKSTFSNNDLNQKLQATLSPQKQEAFKTNILSIVSNNKLWESADPVSINQSKLYLQYERNLSYN